MVMINWGKPLTDKHGNSIKTVGAMLKEPLDGFNMVCVVSAYGRDEHTIIYANELTGNDKDGPNIQNVKTKLDWSKPLITVSGGKACRMVFEGVRTKHEDVRFLILVSNGGYTPNGSGVIENETMFVNEYGQNGNGVDRVKNKIVFESIDDEDDED